MATCLGCGSAATCDCFVIGAGLVTVTGVGSEVNPYVATVTCAAIEACVGPMLASLGFGSDFTASGGAGGYLVASATPGAAAWHPPEWNLVAIPGMADFSSSLISGWRVAYGGIGGYWVLLGDNIGWTSTDDGDTWTTIVTPPNAFPYQLAWAGDGLAGHWCLASDDEIWVSPDAVTWTQRTPSGPVVASSAHAVWVFFGGISIVTYGSTGIAYTGDGGLTYTSVDVGTGGMDTLGGDMAVIIGRATGPAFVASGPFKTTPTATVNGFSTSPDIVTWTPGPAGEIPIPAAGTFNRVLTGGSDESSGTFLMGSDLGIIRSTDGGFNWTPDPAVGEAGLGTGIVYHGSNVWHALNAPSGGGILFETLDDGLTWATYAPAPVDNDAHHISPTREILVNQGDGGIYWRTR